MSTLPNYTFLSWYRRGMSAYIEQPDDPATSGTAPSLTFGITLDDQGGQQETITQTMPLIGPGHITGIRPEAILQTTPLAGASAFIANYMASIEFYEEDLPWRYTPAAPHNNRLRPWMWLLVVAEGEYRVVHHSSSPLAKVILPAALEDGTPNPALDIPPDEAWAWAHVQVNQSLNTINLPQALRITLENNPDLAFSRIISPRRLAPDTRYHAFLVPFFERGRLAGLGEDASTADVLAAAWTSSDLSQGDKAFPFYYEWEFATGLNGDFETLARKLEPQEISGLPLIQMNIEEAQTYFKTALVDNDATSVTELESALMAVGQNAAPFPALGSNADAALTTRLAQQLNPVVDTTGTTVNHIPTANLSEDIVVGVPPVYGKWHLSPTDWQALGGNLNPADAGWIHQLNTDLKARALAGLGVQVVRQHQETFVQEAWAQIGEVMAANRKINQAFLARESSHQLHRRLQGSSQDRQIAATGTLHTRILHDNGTTAQSIAHELDKSNLTQAPTDGGFTKLRRPSLGAIKRLKKQADQYIVGLDPNAQFLQHINQTTAHLNINGAPPKPSPYQSSTTTTTTTTGIFIGDTQKLSNHLDVLSATPVPAADLVAQQQVVLQATDPLFTVQKRLLDQLTVLSSQLPEGVLLQEPSADHLQPIQAAPQIKRPMYPYLKSIAQRLILPNLTAYGDNFVGLLQVNQTFIEQVLAGANHEMGKELLWRGYPTDQRGTYFRQFWNVNDHLKPSQGAVPYQDIAPMHTWTPASPLGSHRPADYPTAPVVLVLKGELIRANPDLVIYAHKAISNPQLDTNPAARPQKLLQPNPDDTALKYPIFRADLAPDIVALGFDLDVAAAKGDAQDAGWFFVLKERPGNVKLGMDEGGTAPAILGSWNDLHWDHMPTTSQGRPYLSPAQTLDFGGGNMPPLATSAAELATRLYQAPLMLGIHAKRLLP